MVEAKQVSTRPSAEAARSEEPTRIPAVDIYETEENVVLLADMPGVSDDGLDVTVEEGTLSIVGRVNDVQAPEMNVLYAEYRPLTYRRTFTLSSDLRTDGIEGTMRNGVLRLTLPKAEEAKVRRIPIKTE